MKAITAESYGAPDVLRLTEVGDPQPGPGQLLVKVEAAGVNYADVMMRSGTYPGGPAAPFIPGLEVAGVIAAGPRKGESVMGFTWSNGYAEYALVPESAAFPIPNGISTIEAAGFLVTHLTAYFALWMADIKPGERVLIHSGAGGVGTAAVQLARAMGGEVFATSSSDDKLHKVKELGAQHIINYSRLDFAEEVRRLTSGEGVDIVLESVGGEVMEKDFSLLRNLGRMIIFGSLSGEAGFIDPGLLLGRNLAVHGLFVGSMLAETDLVDQALDELGDYIRRGKLKPVIGHQLPLADAAEAHRLLQSHEAYGKIVLVP